MHQIPLDSAALADKPELDAERDDGAHEVLADLAYQRLAMVNVMYVGSPATGNWVLIDTGVPGSAGAIFHTAEQRFGKDRPPAAIVLTHAHADHVGALETLLSHWDVPVYAHSLEAPYLDGRAAFPPPDPKVGGGMMSALAGLFPRGPFHVERWLRELPADGSVPPLPGWQWLHTPGHTPGHVSFWRPDDRTLIAGDAFITTCQESVYAVALQRLEMHGPPMYYTQNWTQAHDSVRQLAALEPELAVTGHGRAVRGPALRHALHQLANNFERVAVPDHGRYVDDPTAAEDGSAYVAPHHS